MVAVRDSETAARSIGLNPVDHQDCCVRDLGGVRGSCRCDLRAADDVRRAGFVSVLAIDPVPARGHRRRCGLGARAGGRRGRDGDAAGAVCRASPNTDCCLSGPAARRALARARRRDRHARPLPAPHRPADAQASDFDLAAFLSPRVARPQLVVCGIGISFGGIKAASDVSFTAQARRRITSVIGPNGAGKTTVLNMIGGFYRPDVGSIRIGETELAGAPAWRIARAGIARTYQTTQLFGAMSVLDNILVALAPRKARQSVAQHCHRRGPARRRSAARVRRLSRTARSACRRPAACRPPSRRDRAGARDASASPAAGRTSGRPDAFRQGGAQQS